MTGLKTTISSRCAYLLAAEYVPGWPARVNGEVISIDYLRYSKQAE